MPNEKKEIKVTDKRMFTADGDLREEYRFLKEKSTSAAEAGPAQEPAAPAQPEPQRWEAAPRQAAPGPDPGAAGMDDYSTMPPELGGPSLYDLVAMMAEPIPIYLGDARLPDGQAATNLEMARLHIDLLEVLREKTLGNLTAQESSFLEDLLYRLRVRYVQKTR
ncbi:MAG: DUF1844 domain-containing protein [Thermoanaerobaculia bacterium]